MSLHGLFTVSLITAILNTISVPQKTPRCLVNNRGCGQLCKGESAMSQYHSVRILASNSGTRHGKWVEIGAPFRAKMGKKPHETMVVCKCDCGRIDAVRRGNLVSGSSLGCRDCYYAEKSKQTHKVNGVRCRPSGYGFHQGSKQGLLTIIGEQFQIGREWWATCQCRCGTIKAIRMTGILRKQKSCGCALVASVKSRSTKHGQCKQGNVSRLYRIWSAMKNRCANKSQINYKWYGGKGISVCEEWRSSFSAFQDWSLKHGYMANLTIDRVDSHGDYSPNNCRWVTRGENARQYRHFITIDGTVRSLTEWAKISGTKQPTIRRRLRLGWNNQQAVFGRTERGPTCSKC